MEVSTYGIYRGLGEVWKPLFLIIPGYSGIKREQKGLKTPYKPGGNGLGGP